MPKVKRTKVSPNPVKLRHQAKVRVDAVALYYQLRQIGLSHQLALTAVIDFVFDSLDTQ